MIEQLAELLRPRLKFANPADVACLLERRWSRPTGPSSSDLPAPENDAWTVDYLVRRLDRNEAILQDCEDAAEFVTPGTSEERREQLAIQWQSSRFTGRAQTAPVHDALGPLSTADLDEIHARAVAGFFTVDALDTVLREGSPKIYSSDLLDAPGIVAWFEQELPLPRYLFERAEQPESGSTSPETGGFPEREFDPTTLAAHLLSLLNRLVKDPEIWPTDLWLDVVLAPETIAAGRGEDAGRRERRRYHRRLLNDLFRGRLAPRLGYSPVLGTLRTYLHYYFGKRLIDQRKRFLAERHRGIAPDAPPREPYPFLNPDDLVDVEDFLRALLDPPHPRSAAAIWRTALDTDSPELFREVRTALGTPRPLHLAPSWDLVTAALNRLFRAPAKPPATREKPGGSTTSAALRWYGPVFHADQAHNASIPLPLRSYLAAAEDTFLLVDLALTLHRRRTLELSFPGLVRPAPPVFLPKLETETEPDWDDARDPDVIPAPLRNPYYRAILDLFLLTYIDPTQYGRATRTALEWAGAQGTKKKPAAVALVHELLRLEYEDARNRWFEIRDGTTRLETEREQCEYRLKESKQAFERLVDPDGYAFSSGQASPAGRGKIRVLDTWGTEDELKDVLRHLGSPSWPPPSALRNFLLQIAEAASIGTLEDLLQGTRVPALPKHIRTVLHHALDRVRYLRAEHRVKLNRAVRDHHVNFSGQWLRAQETVAHYLKRDQSTISRTLSKAPKSKEAGAEPFVPPAVVTKPWRQPLSGRSATDQAIPKRTAPEDPSRKSYPEGSLLSLARPFAALREAGFVFPNDDQDPVGPNR